MACHVVGHKVYDDFQAGAVGTLYQIFEFLHTSGNVLGQVGVYVVVILDGIGRTGLTLDYGRMVGADVVASVVSLCGVLDDARVPDVRGTQPLDFAQGLTREVGHFTAGRRGCSGYCCFRRVG